MVLLKISRYPTPGSIRENLDIQLLVLLETSRIDILILVLLEQMSSSISLCTLKVYVEVYVAVNVSFTAPYSWFGFFPETYLINLSRTLFNSACIWNFTSLKNRALEESSGDLWNVLNVLKAFICYWIFIMVNRHFLAVLKLFSFSCEFNLF